VEGLDPHAQGALVRVGFGRPQLSFEEDGRRAAPPGNVAATLQRIPPTFVVDATNKLRSRTDINLNTKLPLSLREDVADYSDQICNGYEAANMVMPNRQLQPQESWPIQVPMLFKSGAKKSEIADLVLNCTYDGVRTQQDRQEALVTVNGR